MPPPTAVESPAPVRPFLKWAGGKRQLLRDLRRFVPAVFHAYHEPFLGSGALFFDLWRGDRLRTRRSRLTDLNADLIGTCQAIVRDVEGVIRELRVLAVDHERGGAAAYYRIRDEVFNPRRRERAGVERPEPYPAALAAVFIYLNRTGYNGLFRLNARGDFNVPAGRYATPRICDAETLRAVSGVLGTRAIEVCVESFTSVERYAGAGDFVYLDPPYAPLTSTARFTSYTPGSFSDADQEGLHALVLRLVAAGCFVVVSNSTAPLVARLYENREARLAGLRTHRIPARRAINSKAGRRGLVEEYIISNVEPRNAGAHD